MENKRIPIPSLGTKAVLKPLRFERLFPVDYVEAAADAAGVPHCKYVAYHNLNRSVVAATLIGTSDVGPRRQPERYPAPVPTSKAGISVTQYWPTLLEGSVLKVDFRPFINGDGKVDYQCYPSTHQVDGREAIQAVCRKLLDWAEKRKISVRLITVRHVRLIRFLREMGLVPPTKLFGGSGEPPASDWLDVRYIHTSTDEWPVVFTKKELSVALPVARFMAERLIDLCPKSPTKDYVLGWSENDPEGVLKHRECTPGEIRKVLVELIVTVDKLLNSL